MTRIYEDLLLIRFSNHINIYNYRIHSNKRTRVGDIFEKRAIIRVLYRSYFCAIQEFSRKE